MTRIAMVVACVTVSIGAAQAAPPSATIVAQELSQALNATPDGERGARLFADICAACHGPDGAGLPVGWAPEIAGQHPRVIVKQLIDFRAGVRWYDPMERIAGRHVLQTTQEIADVAAYAGKLPPMPVRKVGNGEWLARGKELYANQCQSCHGEKGEGSDAQMIPRVGGQQFEYLLWQLHDVVDGRRPNMKQQHLRQLKSFVMEDLGGVADYMSRLRASDQPVVAFENARR